MKKEQIQNVLFYVILLIVTFSIIIHKPLGDLDEIWNYNFARNVAEGLVPYKDFNMLQMPLLPMLCGGCLKIITNQLIVMRVLAAVMCSAILYIGYKILCELDIKKEIAMSITILLLLLMKDVLCIDYNYATLLVALCLVLCELKHHDNTEHQGFHAAYHMGIGILAGLTMTLKQTSGIFIIVASLGYPLLLVRNKHELKKYIKIASARLLGVMIPVGTMLVYLTAHHAMGDFVSYTIKGVSGFSNYISYKKLLKPTVIGVLAVLVPVTMIGAWVHIIVREKDQKLLSMLAYGMAMLVVAFPISNEIHFLIGSYILLLMLAYICVSWIETRLHHEQWKKIVAIFVQAFLMMVAIGFAGVNYYQYFTNPELYSSLNHYKYIPASPGLEKQIEEVDQYIENSKEEVLMLDASAAVYMIPLEKYHKDYDMLLKGNIGEAGEEKLIEDISNTEGRKYLILKDGYSKNWQTPWPIIDFVKENRNKVSEVSIFDIYE